MAKTDLVFSTFKESGSILLEGERCFLEIKLLIHFYEGLLELFNNRYNDYLKLIQSNYERNWTSIKFMQELIKDILATEEYTLSGIAEYSNIPEEVLYDVAAGVNDNPSFDISRKLFQLHMTLRPDIYKNILQKVIAANS